MAADSTIIMEEGVATFFYKVVYIDENLVVLNLDGTDSFCFLINDSFQSFSDAPLAEILYIDLQIWKNWLIFVKNLFHE